MTQRDQNGNCFCGRAAMRQQQSLTIFCDTFRYASDNLDELHRRPHGRVIVFDLSPRLGPRHGSSNVTVNSCREQDVVCVCASSKSCYRKSRGVSRLGSSARGSVIALPMNWLVIRAPDQRPFAPRRGLRQKARLQCLTEPFPHLNGHNAQRLRRRPIDKL
jgi:hypothetical protein